jgi:hypothetical protein
VIGEKILAAVPCRAGSGKRGAHCLKHALQHRDGASRVYRWLGERRLTGNIPEKGEFRRNLEQADHGRAAEAQSAESPTKNRVVNGYPEGTDPRCPDRVHGLTSTPGGGCLREPRSPMALPNRTSGFSSGLANRARLRLSRTRRSTSPPASDDLGLGRRQGFVRPPASKLISFLRDPLALVPGGLFACSESAPEVADYGVAEDRSDHFNGYTVNFSSAWRKAADPRPRSRVSSSDADLRGSSRSPRSCCNATSVRPTIRRSRWVDMDTCQPWPQHIPLPQRVRLQVFEAPAPRSTGYSRQD